MDRTATCITAPQDSSVQRRSQCGAVWVLLTTAWSLLTPSVLQGQPAQEEPQPDPDLYLENKGTPWGTLGCREHSPVRTHPHAGYPAPLPDTQTGIWRGAPGAPVTTRQWDVLSWTRKVKTWAVKLCSPLLHKCVHLPEIRDTSIKAGRVPCVWQGADPRPLNKRSTQTSYLCDTNSHLGGINGNSDPILPC